MYLLLILAAPWKWNSKEKFSAFKRLCLIFCERWEGVWQRNMICFWKKSWWIIYKVRTQQTVWSSAIFLKKCKKLQKKNLSDILFNVTACPTNIARKTNRSSAEMFWRLQLQPSRNTPYLLLFNRWFFFFFTFPLSFFLRLHGKLFFLLKQFFQVIDNHWTNGYIQLP